MPAPLQGIKIVDLTTVIAGPYATQTLGDMAMPYTAAHWQALFRAAGREDWATQPALSDGAARAAMIDTLYERLAECLTHRSSAEWLAILDRIDVPCSAINTLDDLLDDPHLKATGFFETVEHPTEGRLLTTKPPIRFSATPCAITKPAPGRPR